MPTKTPKKTNKKPKDKAADEVSLLLQARRYDTTGAINWANGPRGTQLMGAYAYVLQEYGFSEGEIEKLMPALAYNTYLFVKKY
jgi:hypothetical protein